jgi:hypothetical protein
MRPSQQQQSNPLTQAINTVAPIPLSQKTTFEIEDDDALEIDK